MRILIATTQVPFVQGGAEIHANNLLHHLREAGHQAELVAIPFKHDPPERILDHMLACRLLDISAFNGQAVDRVIGLKFPTYLLQHPNMVLWVLHQYRAAYDLWNTPYCDLIHTPMGLQIRENIVLADNQAFQSSRRIFANSGNVAARMRRYNQVEATPLYHPPQHAERFFTETAEDYFFFPSRLTPIKRQELVIQALAETRNPVKVVFAGRPDQDAYLDHLRAMIERLQLSDRAILLGGISEADKYRYFARSLGVVFTPVDEDYGYITLEAMLSGKAVITCEDAGGPLEFVRHGETGWIAAPTPMSVAAALDHLWSNRPQAYALGQAGRALYDDLEISWANVVGRLLA